MLLLLLLLGACSCQVEALQELLSLLQKAFCLAHHLGHWTCSLLCWLSSCCPQRLLYGADICGGAQRRHCKAGLQLLQLGL